MSKNVARYAPNICPECTAGKHRNCDGDAWDDVHDRVTTCECDTGECKGSG